LFNNANSENRDIGADEVKEVIDEAREAVDDLRDAEPEGNDEGQET